MTGRSSQSYTYDCVLLTPRRARVASTTTELSSRLYVKTHGYARCIRNTRGTSRFAARWWSNSYDDVVFFRFNTFSYAQYSFSVATVFKERNFSSGREKKIGVLHNVRDFLLRVVYFPRASARLG